MRTPLCVARCLAVTMLTLASLSAGSTLPVVTRSAEPAEARGPNSDGGLRAGSGRHEYRAPRSMSTVEGRAPGSALSGADDSLAAAPTSVPRGKIAFSRSLSIGEVHTMNADGSNQIEITNSQGFDGSPVWSPDGSRIAFTSGRDGNDEIYVMNADGSNPARLTHDPAIDRGLTWSPDGSKIAFTRVRISLFDANGSSRIYVMNADGSNGTQFASPGCCSFDTDPAWSPDGSRIAFTRNASNNPEVFVANADGGNLTRLTNSIGLDSEPAWSPDGARIAFTSERDGNAEVYVMSPDGGSQTRLTNTPQFDASPAWSPDSTKITFRSDRDGNAEIYVMNADGNNQTRLTHNPADEREPHWSPDGVRIAFATSQSFSSEIYVMNSDGGSLLNLTNHPAHDFGPAWSPDGTKIAFVRFESDTQDLEIYVMNADGTNQINLTNSPGFDAEPAWLPDGNRIVFRRNDGIYVMNADGSDQTRLTNFSVNVAAPAWSPDGTRIAFVNNGGICVMDTNGVILTCLTTSTLFEAAAEPAWSPDGTRISYTIIPIFSDQWTSQDEIFVMNADGTNQVNLTNTPKVVDGHAAWSPDGNNFAFFSQRDGNSEIYVMNADGGDPIRITNNLNASNQDPEWQPLQAAPTSTVQFSAAGYSVGEEAGNVVVTVNRTGNASGAATVSFASSGAEAGNACNVVNGAASPRCDYASAFGPLRFAPGETTQIFSLSLVDDAYIEGPESLTITLKELAGANLGALSTATITINDNDSGSPTNPIDGPAFFVRQHYLDFLNREPDDSGLAFWTNQITSCGIDQECVELKRINVSAAFFLSIEFQETGYFAYRAYKAAYGDATFPGVPGTVPVIRLAEFLVDSQRLGNGVQVGISDWQEKLEANKQAYALEFVQRQRFVEAFPSTMSADAFVTKLDQQTGGALSPHEKTQLTAALAPDPGEARRRAQVLRIVAEDAQLKQAEFNRAFVLMQYYGYLRRNPDESPDVDFGGWKFWVSKLDQFNGNFIQSEMVKSFLTSLEYRQRFGVSGTTSMATLFTQKW